MLIDLATRITYGMVPDCPRDAIGTDSSLANQQALASSRLRFQATTFVPEQAEISSKYQYIMHLTAESHKIDLRG